MDFPLILIIILATFGVAAGLQGYQLYRAGRIWGYGEIVVRWISPEQKRTISLIAVIFTALIIAVLLRSEELLSALSFLLIGFGGLLSQFIFINIIGKEGIYLGRIKKGLLWDEIEKIYLVQSGNKFEIEISAFKSVDGPQRKNIFRQIHEEMQSLTTFDEADTEAIIKPEENENDFIIKIEDRLSRELKQEEMNEKEPDRELSIHSVGISDKHQFRVQQALMYYFTRGFEYKHRSE